MALCVGIVCLAANSSGNRPSEVGRVPPRARSGVQSDIRISITVCCRLCLDGGALAKFFQNFHDFSDYFSEFFRIFFCPMVLLCVLFRCRCRFCGWNPFAVALPRSRTRTTKKRRCVPGRICSSYMLLTRTSRIRVSTRWVPGLSFLFWSVLVAPLSSSGAGEPIGETPGPRGAREPPTTPAGLFASARRLPAGFFFVCRACLSVVCFSDVWIETSPSVPWFV